MDDRGRQCFQLDGVCSPTIVGMGKREKWERRASELGSRNSKRVLEENGSDEGSSRVVRKRALIGVFKVIVRFSKADEQIILHPVMLSRELRKKLGEVREMKTC